MSSKSVPVDFRGATVSALENLTLRGAMKTATDMFAVKRAQGVSSIPLEEWRQQASETRCQVLDNLEAMVDEFSANATKAGAVIHRAKDAETARRIILDILKNNRVHKLVKAKSMVSEEIHLNRFLEQHDIKVVETDLGEYIVQIADETPSHILAPAIHKNRRQVGLLFSEKLGVDYSEDPEVLTKIARRQLRNEFLTADAGFSGANFAVSSTGSLAIFTNEGNGRMCTTVPPLHIALITIEKMLPTLADLALFAKLLPRSATGQFLSSYMTLITGTKKTWEFTGAGHLHIVLLDNGRTDILRGPFRDILKCIRCSACMNVCPVYRTVGGHAYDSTYSGPMGIILTNLLEGMERAHTLLDASTLCGACEDACPVKLPLVSLISALREKRVEMNMGPVIEHFLMKSFGLAAQKTGLYAFAQKMFKKTRPLVNRVGDGLRLDRLPEISEKPMRDRF